MINYLRLFLVFSLINYAIPGCGQVAYGDLLVNPSPTSITAQQMTVQALATNLQTVYSTLNTALPTGFKLIWANPWGLTGPQVYAYLNSLGDGCQAHTNIVKARAFIGPAAMSVREPCTVVCNTATTVSVTACPTPSPSPSPDPS